MQLTVPSKVVYIKLGKGGAWEEECIKQNQTLKLGFDDANHGQCLQGKWKAVHKHFGKWHDPSKATQQTNEVKVFYEADQTALWITFHDGFLWWCFSKRKVTQLDDRRKIRPVIGQWRNKSVVGDDLRLENLDKRLTKKQYFQGTILHLKGGDEDYALRTILGVTKSDGKHSTGLKAAATKLTDEDYFSPTGLKDERERCLREIVQRRGQAEFRNKLIGVYGGRCVVTGCDAVAALEAAHIVPYLGPKTNSVTNGLLLRADVHTLFDLDLIGVEPTKLTIHLNPVLKKTCYAELQGVKLSAPTDESVRPNAKALEQRWKQFLSG